LNKKKKRKRGRGKKGGGEGEGGGGKEKKKKKENLKWILLSYCLITEAKASDWTCSTIPSSSFVAST
jgi:hypothetical protein